MKTVLFANDFISIEYMPEIGVVRATWTKKTSEMYTEDFQTCIKEIWKAVREKLPKGFMGDTRNFGFTIPPETQEWYGTNIKDTFSNTPKIAMLMSSEFISQLSIEQTIEEDKNTGVTTRYFDDENQALQWLAGR
jgi:hypothetical protein